MAKDMVLGSDKSSSIESESFLAPVEHRERAFSRLKSAADKRREYRVNSILSQEGEGITKTLGRILFLSACIIFDGLILTEIIVYLGRTIIAWLLFGIILAAAIFLQSRLYSAWFGNS